MQDIRAQVGLEIQRRRRVQGLSQEELADRAGVDRAYISRIERGIPDIGIELLTRVSIALRLHPAELLRPIDIDGKGDDTGAPSVE